MSVMVMTLTHAHHSMHLWLLSAWWWLKAWTDRVVLQQSSMTLHTADDSMQTCTIE